MVTHRIDGAILSMIISGDVTAHDRQSLFAAIADDPELPDTFALLVDARDSTVTFKDATIEVRLLTMVEALGPNFNRVCAFLEPRHDPLYGKAFQRAGEKHGIRIGLFKEAAEAMRWLAPYTDTPKR